MLSRSPDIPHVSCQQEQSFTRQRSTWARNVCCNAPVWQQASWPCMLIPPAVRIWTLSSFADQYRVISIGFVLLTCKTTDPYHAHLLGVTKPPTLIPFILPYKAGERRMFSDMSFKCRSTSTFSSYTIAEPDEDILYKLYPTRPEKAYGLGIYAPKTSTANFLAPRPSLRTIRSHASFGPPPLKSSPVPPLPVYDPEKYRNMPAMQKISAAPKRVYTLRRKNSRRPLRIVQHDPIPSDNKPHTLDKSNSKESLSSIYSRSVSGDSPDLSCRPVLGIASGQVLNAPSACRNPLDGNQSGLGSGRGCQPKLHSELRENSTSQTINATTDGLMGAQSRLPTVRAVSTFGNVQDWETANVFDTKSVRNGRVSTWTERCNLPPLPVERAKSGRQ